MCFCYMLSGDIFVALEKMLHESESPGPLRGNGGVISFCEKAKNKGPPSICFTSL